MSHLDDTMRYDRAIPENFLALLRSGGVLNRLMAPGSIGGLPLDAQLRGDRVTIYAGLTRIAEFRWQRGKRLKVSAAATYASQMPSFFRDYAAAELGQVADRWEQFRASVAVAKSLVENEGALQARLVERYGRNYVKGDPWCLVDRESVLQHPTGSVDKARFEGEITNAFEDVLRAIKEDRTIEVGKNADKAFGDELDLLGVTEEQDLVVCEVKDGANSVSGLYMAPVQVAAYHERWTRVPDAKRIAGDVNALIDQKVAIGLLPPTAPRLRPEFAVNAVVVSSEPPAGSSAWSIYASVCQHLAQHRRPIAERLRTFVADRIGSRITCTPRLD